MAKVKCWEKGNFVFILITLIIFVSFTKLCAAGSKFDDSILEAKSIEIGGSASFGYDENDATQVYTLLPRAGIFFARNAEVEVEIPLEYINTKKSDAPGFGVSINALYHLNTGTRFVPFALVGMGAEYVAGGISDITSLVTMPQGGVGLKYFLSERMALRVEYRYRHFSDPFVHDGGIDAQSIMFGVSIFPSR
ncbi:MAG: outer membrane protein [Candidatus Brocadiales bacterium]